MWRKKMRFISRNKEAVVRIASTSGHIVLIGNEFVDVPEHMEAEAYANGCVSEELYKSIRADIEKDAGAKQALVGGGTPAEADRSPVIEQVMNDMLASTDEGYFTKAGLPNLKVLEKLCGFTVSRDEMETCWGKVSQKLADNKE
jgi:hypothetical protein